jgi:hypothetical protein
MTSNVIDSRYVEYHRLQAGAGAPQSLVSLASDILMGPRLSPNDLARARQLLAAEAREPDCLTARDCFELVADDLLASKMPPFHSRDALGLTVWISRRAREDPKLEHIEVLWWIQHNLSRRRRACSA